MCKYLITNNNNVAPQCSITNTICPFMYFCNKDSVYKPMNSMDSCNKKNEIPKPEIPKGYCEVLFERRGNLFIKDLNNNVIELPNPFEEFEIPPYVKLYKTKSGETKIKK